MHTLTSKKEGEAAPKGFPPLFPLGQLVSTIGAVEALDDAGDNAIAYIRRHLRGDWGDVCPEDAQANDWSLQHGERILSAYHTSAGVKLWVITEWDRSATTILLPSEY